MKRVAEYLLKNYYPKTQDIPTPDEDVLIRALEVCKDKIIIVGDIDGVGIYLTLTDSAVQELTFEKVSSPESLGVLLKEQGDNVHFITLCCNGCAVIRQGLRGLKYRTVSWFDPKTKKLKIYRRK